MRILGKLYTKKYTKENRADFSALFLRLRHLSRLKVLQKSEFRKVYRRHQRKHRICGKHVRGQSIDVFRRLQQTKRMLKMKTKICIY